LVYPKAAKCDSEVFGDYLPLDPLYTDQEVLTTVVDVEMSGRSPQWLAIHCKIGVQRWKGPVEENSL
jgi:hypothetical protein